MEQSRRHYKRMQFANADCAKAAAEAFREMWGAWPWEEKKDEKMTTKFAKFDSKQADGIYVTSLTLVTEHDDCGDKPDDRDCGFWPSRRKDDPGYVAPERFDDAQKAAVERMAAWKRGDWYFMGVMAKATICVVRDGVGTSYEFVSAGLWGIESDAGDDYVLSVFEEEKASLIEDVKSMGELPLHVAGDKFYK